MDKRAEKLANLVVNYCLEVKKGQKILIDATTEAEEFVEACLKAVLKAGAFPILRLTLKNNKQILLENSINRKQLEFFPNSLLEAAKEADAVIDIENESSNLTKISPDKVAVHSHTMKPYWDYLIYEKNKCRRVTMLVPSKKHAKDANMSEKEFEDFVYSASLINWEKITKRFEKVRKVFEDAKEVHLIGKNVDLKFSKKGRNCILENGKENMPGGEMFIAPIKDSLEGWIKFEYPAHVDALFFSNIYLKFEKGKIVDFDAKQGKALLKRLLDTDSGSRYIGEFGIGINPFVKKGTNSWIDEKIDGTIHLAIGRSYDENGGDNDSAIHWDITKDMTQAKIILDGKVVQENGKWLI
jgi:aminopeptidase